MNGYFITGTDTGVGKTAVTAALCALLRGRGIDAAPAKPVQTGVAPGEPGDLEHGLEVCGLTPEPDEKKLMNPCRFRLPSSPHLAAEMENTAVDVDYLEACCRELAACHEMVLVEGAGGLLVPLTRTVSTLDFAARLGLPLVIVARAGLGTINHSLLTIRAARDVGLEIACVMLNRTVPEPENEDDKKIEADNAKIISKIGEVNVAGPLPFIMGIDKEKAVSIQLCDYLSQAANITKIFPNS